MAILKRHWIGFDGKRLMCAFVIGITELQRDDMMEFTNISKMK